MSRLVVRNSPLVDPPVPDAVLRPDDVLLPLVDKFEETLFMAGPGYPELQALFPSFSLDVRARARRIAEVLPPWLGERIAGLGYSAWADRSQRIPRPPRHLRAADRGARVGAGRRS